MIVCDNEISVSLPGLRTTTLFLFLFFSVPLSAQFLRPDKVPAAAKATLAEFFPKVEFPLWRTLGPSYYAPEKFEASFSYNNRRTWATVDTTGNLFVIEEALEKDSIPPSATAYLTENYKFKKFIEARKIHLSDKNFVVVIVKGYRTYHSLLFDESGTYISGKNDLAGYVVSVLVSAFIFPDLGLFKPFKIREGVIGPKFEYSPDKK
jgi:hypothetical protein